MLVQSITVFITQYKEHKRMNINPNVVLAVIIATATIIKETLENEEK